MAHDPQVIGIKGIAYIFTQDHLLHQFLTESGGDIAALHTKIEDPETAAAGLDFLLNNEPALLDFCSNADIKPEYIWKARLKLPGAPREI